MRYYNLNQYLPLLGKNGFCDYWACLLLEQTLYFCKHNDSLVPIHMENNDEALLLGAEDQINLTSNSTIISPSTARWKESDT